MTHRNSRPVTPRNSLVGRVPVPRYAGPRRQPSTADVPEDGGGARRCSGPLGALKRTLDPDLGYHYGAPVDSVRAGDELTLSTATVPQAARHEGYETAFREMDDVSIAL